MFSRTCLIADHQSKDIVCVCTHLDCQESRFLCSKCVRPGNHKHGLQDNSHILDHEEFYAKIMNGINQRQDSGNQDKEIKKPSTGPLKPWILEIQNQVKSILNIIQYNEEGIYLQNNDQYLLQELAKIKKTGFKQIDDQVINQIINLPNNKQIVHVDIKQELETQLKIIIENAQKIKEWQASINNDNKQIKQIQNLQYQIKQLDQTKDKFIITGAISNDLNYVISGGQDKKLKILDYDS